MQKHKTSNQHHDAGMLYIVATPIGNLADMTFRAVDVLKTVDIIACEDTRTSRVLCQHYQITTPLIAFHEHNEQQKYDELLQKISGGLSIAVISDAGTPLISDPGYRIVHEAHKRGIKVVPIAGASSIITALSAAGVPTDAFYYAGFLPNKSQARQSALQQMQTVSATLVMLESNHRLVECLRDAELVLGNRTAVVARELTKAFEEFTHGTLRELADDYAAREKVRGEIVLLIAPAMQETSAITELTDVMQALLAHYPVKQVASLLAPLTHHPKKAIYDAAQALKDG
jgi:16S rRNA (cytidine1402-2'-O)-methyltransferase